jgi:hypothetical protein
MEAGVYRVLMRGHAWGLVCDKAFKLGASTRPCKFAGTNKGNLLTFEMVA